MSDQKPLVIEWAEEMTGVINRFLDHQMAFDPAADELVRLVLSFVRTAKANEERMVQEVAGLPGQPTPPGSPFFSYADGRSPQERQAARDLVREAFQRLARGADGAA
jgi:hypothetical protein